MAGELVEFEDGTEGIALNLEDDNVGIVLMGQGLGIQEGSTVRATGKIASVPVGDATARTGGELLLVKPLMARVSSLPMKHV